ncbi:MAG: NBR1-Ig-like domain-containing protein [Candidatus Andersenbacteria bacterium]
MLTNSPRSTPSSFSPPPAQSRSLLKLVLVVVGLLVIGAAVYIATTALPDDSSVSPNRATEPQIPPLATMGSNNPADSAAIAAHNVSFADLTHDLSPEQVIQTINERLGLSTADADNDGLSNAAEVLIYGTNPRYFDTDVDGATDGSEVEGNTNPLLAANTWTDEEREVIKSRIAYWGTDFSLSPIQRAQSSRDINRLAHAGQIRVLLALYYEEHAAYPRAPSWEQAWEILKTNDAGGMFSHGHINSKWKEGMFDPLNLAPFVYTYTTDAQGSAFTFTYAVEGEQVLYTFTDARGEPGEVSKQLLSNVSAPAAVSRILPLRQVKQILHALVPTALALHVPVTDLYVDSVYTTDGVRVEVYQWEGNTFWRDYAMTHTVAQLKNHFLIAASVYQPPGYCDQIGCFCNNGSTLIFARNNSQCQGGVAVPRENTVKAGQPFAAVVNLVNTGTSTWRTDATPHRLGSSSPRDNNLFWGVDRISLGSREIHPQGSVDFNFTAVAPTKPGTYNFDWEMLEEGIEWFGQVCKKPLTVVAAQCADTVDNDGDGVIDAADPGCHTDGNANNAASYDPLDDDEFNPLPSSPSPSASPSVSPSSSPLSARPGVDLKAKAKDGDVPSDALTVTRNSRATLSWTTTNDATTCNASGAWTGSKLPTGSEQTPPLTGTVTYTLRCEGSGGISDPDSVTVTVVSATSTQCSDSKDNDGDGKIDCADPGCRTRPADPATCDPTKNSEVDPVLSPGPIQETDAP